MLQRCPQRDTYHIDTIDVRPNPIVELSKNLLLDALANPSDLTLTKKAKTTRKLGVKRPTPRTNTMKRPDFGKKSTIVSYKNQ